MSFAVAIDGPAAAGKGTLSRAVAEMFGFAHLDTGLLYRAVGKKVNEGADPVTAAQELMAQDLQVDGLRSPQVAEAASKVAVIPEVRAALVDFQRSFAARSGGAVLDGRDIGTVICPQANVKLFVTADADIRARRRHLELAERGIHERFEKVLADVIARDQRDAERTDAPMVQADDAIVIDTSAMSIEDAIAAAAKVIRAALDQDAS
jgi:cytidylate kinase